MYMRIYVYSDICIDILYISIYIFLYMYKFTLQSGAMTCVHMLCMFISICICILYMFRASKSVSRAS